MTGSQLGLDERAVHFWRCRLNLTNPLKAQAELIDRLERQQKKLLNQADQLVAEANKIGKTLGDMGLAAHDDLEIIGGSGYWPKCYCPTSPWYWNGATWEESDDLRGGTEGRILQSYTAYPPDKAPGGAKTVWSQFTFAFKEPPIVMNRHHGGGFCAIYKDVKGDSVEISLSTLVGAS